MVRVLRRDNGEGYVSESHIIRVYLKVISRACYVTPYLLLILGGI